MKESELNTKTIEK